MHNPEKGPIRILKVAGAMDRGGAETLMMHVLRHIDRERFQIDFLVHVDRPAAYDDEIRALGSRILPCLGPRQPIRYARNFRRIVAENGPYDIVHSYPAHFSGYVLRLARQAGIPARIAHSQSARDSDADALPGPLRIVYLALTNRWLQANATAGFAASSDAAAMLFGPRWEEDPRWRVHYNAVDLNPFRAPPRRAEVRAELGIPADAFVIGHVGSFKPVKNHAFLLDLAAQVAQDEPRAHLLLVGDGPLRPEIEAQADRLHLGGRVTFAGLRPDVPRLMGGMDVFALPSLFEGLPLVMLEAQAAGLPCLLSDAVSEEVEVVKPLIRRLSFADSPASWARTLLDLRDNPPAISREEALAQVAATPFNVEQHVAFLERFYAQAAAQPPGRL
jgi:glycosyltransferase involved in cell wall biosynthesis